MSTPDPVTQNVRGVSQLIQSRVNKVNDNTVEPEPVDEFSVDMSDEELLELSKQWEVKYAPYKSQIEERQKRIKAYYEGKQKLDTGVATDGEPISSNLIFEAVETFLAAALARNPEPVVYGANNKESNEVAEVTKTILAYHADTLALRQKMKRSVRHWNTYLIGVVKNGWDDKIEDISCEVRDPRNFIFSPTAQVDPSGYINSYVGEKVKIKASELVEMFPKHKEYITIHVDSKMGTEVEYTEWWNDDYVFYTFKDRVLDKNKNPHFNYEQKRIEVDEFGVETEVVTTLPNHFAKPRNPYNFLTVFNLGEQPHDVTNLIEQNIANQNRITRRTIQLDYNLSRSNNSDVFSEDNFNEETAKQAAMAMQKGNPVLVPKGKDINQAIARLQSPGVGGEFFNDLEIAKRDLRTIFGVEGITSQAVDEDHTVRGLIMGQQFDNTRIGGGIGDAMEQFADGIFNYWVQLYHVYYDDLHFGAVLGKAKAVNYVELERSMFDGKLVVSVAPNSLKPKDEVSKINQAIALYRDGALDPKTLFTILDFPDVDETAQNSVLWQVDKMMYMQMNFPEIAQQIMNQQAQAAMQQAGVAPQGGQLPPEAITEPQLPIEAPPVDPTLSQVPLPPI